MSKRANETYGEREQRHNRWVGVFWVAVILLSIYAAVFGKSETFAEQAVRCDDQRIQSFKGCMGWIEGRVMR